MFKSLFGSEFNRERLGLILIITILVFIWFHKGLILGSGESGLPFVNSQKLLDLSIHMWSDTPLGTTTAIGYASVPFYLVVVGLLGLKIPPFLIQALMYWIVFVAGVLSVHKLASLIPGNNRISRISSSLFYIFNPIVHVAILHRFQYPMIFFYGFAPFALLIYYLGLVKKDWWHLVFLSLVSVIFSFAFIGVAFLELLFVVLGFLTVLYFLPLLKNKRKSYFPLLYFGAFGLIFSLVNLWWLAPFFASYFSSGSGSFKYFDPLGNVETFKIISQNLGSITSVFRLVPARFYGSDGSIWGWIYYTPVFVFLSFFSIFAFTVSLLKLKRSFLNFYFIILTFFVMYLMKGSLPPFGDVFLAVMSKISPLQVFRNPFEKIGLILPLVMAIPVGLGIDLMFEYLQNRLKFYKLAVVVLLVIVFPLYCFPIVNGFVFTGGGKPSDDINIGQYVKVPDYYSQAHDFLNKQPGLFRLLTLPLDGEGMTYNWEYGYSGVELSNTLFDQSVISFETGQVFLPEMINTIKRVFNRYPDKFWILSQLMNVKYLIVRDDIDNISRDTESASEDLENINRYLTDHFTELMKIGKLDFFELKNEEFSPRIFAQNDPIYLLDSAGKGLDLIPFAQPQNKDLFITPTEISREDPYISKASRVIINGSTVENLKSDPTKNPLDELPYVSIFKDSPLAFLVRIKEKLEGLTQTNQLGLKINILWKRLADINRAPDDLSSIEEYTKNFKLVSSQILLNGVSQDRAQIHDLARQRVVWDEIKKKTNYKDKAGQITAALDNLLKEVAAKPVFPTEKGLIRRFVVQRDSGYELLVSNEDWKGYYNGEIDEFDLDGKTWQTNHLKESNDENLISLGKFELKKGVHEMAINMPKSVNLIKEELPEEIVLESKDKKPFIKTLELPNLDRNYSYLLSFEYFEQKGNIPIIAVQTDVDSKDKKGETIPRYGIALQRNYYDFGWKKDSFKFSALPSASKYNVILKLLPYGSCKAEVQLQYQKYCENEDFNRRFLKESQAIIRNLKVEKIFSNPVILREIKTPSVYKSIPNITFTQISPSGYKVRVENAVDPYFLVLSTAFDPRWSAYFNPVAPTNILDKFSGGINGEKLPNKSHLVVNGYANAWYIEKPGSYEMYLEYTPERISVAGQKLSVIFIVSLSGLLLWRVYGKYSNR